MGAKINVDGVLESEMIEQATVWQRLWVDRIRGENGDRTVDVGSDLACATDLPFSSVPQLAWRAIAGAGEMAAHSRHCLDQDPRFWLPQEFALARSAALGAARAIFILSPETAAVRHANCLRILKFELDQVKKMVGDLQEFEHPDAKDARAEFDQSWAILSTAMLEIGPGKGKSVNETNLLNWCADQYPTNTKEVREVILRFWRESSAHVHGHSFKWGNGLEAQPHGVQFLGVWMVPLQLLEKAWELWETRRHCVPETQSR